MQKKHFGWLVFIAASIFSLSAHASCPPYRYPRIVVDGDFTDWACLPNTVEPVKASDPQGDVGNGDKVDYTGFKIYSYNRVLYFSYQTTSKIDFTWNTPAFNLFIDTDNDPLTGYQGGQESFVIGADALIQGGTLYTYSGSGSDWNWSPSSPLTYSYSNNRLEMAVAEQQLGLMQGYTLKFLLHGDNSIRDDYFPDDRSGIEYVQPSLVVDGNLTDWDNKIPFSKDSDDQNNNDIDIAKTYLANDLQKLYFKFDLQKTGNITPENYTYIIYLDTDGDIYTGFNGLDAWNIGADYRIYLDPWNVGLQEFIRLDGTSDVWGWKGQPYQLQTIESQYTQESWEGSILREDIAETDSCENMTVLFQTYENNSPYAKDFLPDPQWARTTIYPYKGDNSSCCSTSNTIPGIKSYLVYYGSTASVEELSSYDLVIVQQDAYDRAAIEQIQANGTIVLVYISLGEECKKDDNGVCLAPEKSLGAAGPCYYDRANKKIKYRNNDYAPYYIDNNGDQEPDENGTWKSYFVNAGHQDWQTIIKNQVDTLVNEVGYDGFFLDTVGTAETIQYGWTAQGMVELIAAMREHLDERYGAGKKYLMSNAAVSLFAGYAPYVNGVMLESFSSRWYDEGGKVSYAQWDEINFYNNTRLANMLNSQRCYPQNSSINIFTLDYCAEKDSGCIAESFARAKSFGFTPTVTNKYLDKIYPLPAEEKHSNIAPALFLLLSTQTNIIDTFSFLEKDKRLFKRVMRILLKVTRKASRGRPRKILKKEVKVRVKNKGSQKKKPGRQVTI